MKKSPLFLLYLAVFVAIAGFGMVLPLLPLYAQSLGATTAEIGLLAASFSFGQFFAAPIVGRISDRFGRKPVLGVALLGLSVSFLIFGLAHSLPWLFFSRFLNGIFSSGAFPIASAYIGDTTQKEERVKYMGRLTAVLSLGFIVGPAFAGFLSAYSTTLPFLVASAVALFNSAFIFLFLPESLTKKAEKLVIREGFINLKVFASSLKGEFGVFFFLLFAWAFAISNFQVALPLFAEEKFAYSGTQIAWIFTVSGSVGAFIQFFVLSKVVKIIGKHPTVAMGTIIMAAGQFLISFATGTALLFLFTSISTLGGSFLRPTINALLSEETREGQGTTMGLAFSFESLGRIGGPLLAGVLISAWGTQSQFVATAGVLLLGFLLIFKDLRSVKADRHLK